MLGNNYYRIYQVDYLGDEYYSDLRVVNFEGQVQTRIYPNPTAQNLTIELEQNANENHTLEIIDALGRILKTDTLLKGTYLHQIAVTDLPNGTYILRMTSKNGTSSIQQFIVK